MQMFFRGFPFVASAQLMAADVQIAQIPTECEWYRVPITYEEFILAAQ
jgi:hypothetical protein